MNMQAILTVLILALTGVSSENACSTTEQTSAYKTLASLLTLSTFSGCTTDSGYSLMYSTALPTDAEYVKMCASSNCQSLIKSVISLIPPDCTMKVPTSGLSLNVHTLADGFSTKCSSISTTTPTTTPTASAATPNTTKAKNVSISSTSAPKPTKANAC